MTSARWTIALLTASIISALASYGWAMRSQHAASATMTPATPTASATAKTGRTVLYWHDPMKPEVRFDKPGKSPFMDMQLVPVYADNAGANDGVRVSAATQQNLGVRLGRVERIAIAHTVRAVGSVMYDEHDVAVVQARVGGYVTRLWIRAPLDRVRRGQALAEVTSPAWIEAEGEYLTLLGSPAATSAELRQAARQRLLILGIPETAIAQLEKTRSVPQAITLYAPIDGVITELGVREGAAFSEGAALFRINALTRVWVNAQLPEAQAQGITLGSTVQTRTNAWPGRMFSGRVEALLPQVDVTTRTLTVRVAIDNHEGKLTPGMFVETTFNDKLLTAQLWVPSEALIVTGERRVVIAAGEDGSFRVANVTSGAEADGKTAILSGLTEGQSVVLSGQFLFDSEASLKAAENRLSAAPPSAPPPAATAGPAP
jgi:Cu(I)/Ag(I) efflux system membrane fusion protein